MQSSYFNRVSSFSDFLRMITMSLAGILSPIPIPGSMESATYGQDVVTPPEGASSEQHHIRFFPIQQT
jgi:hypothetical protein